MTQIWICLLTLFFSLNSSASERNAGFWHSLLAAKTGVEAERLVIGRGADLAKP